ncbi:MAG TPA: hypothetical protein VIN66_17125 [Rheinheimera sp.]|mgnify:CR=1 FL=1|uniref:hypothetical protein n=1 Tax=Rheinheimera sp. TaxID=1869214 RepID=UPI002F93B3EB
MKVNLLAATVMTVCVFAVSKADSVNIPEQNASGDLLVCGWYPFCGDPDVYSPLSTPKDSKSKTETQGTKNEKLA